MPTPEPWSIITDVADHLQRWARDRSGDGNDYVAHRFPQWATWLSEAAQPTFKQVQDFANASHTPMGLLPLPAPPVDAVPIPDFRTVANSPQARPSPDLLETISICRQHQEWYRDFARSVGETPRTFVAYPGDTLPTQWVAVDFCALSAFFQRFLRDTRHRSVRAELPHTAPPSGGDA